MRYAFFHGSAVTWRYYSYKNISASSQSPHPVFDYTSFSKNVFVATVDSYAFNLSHGKQYMYYTVFIQSDEELSRLLTRIYRRLT